MGAFLAAAAMAFWLGILTSISPCPLATNIAAVSFLGKQVDRPRTVLLGGLLYTLGRTVAYVALGIIVVGGLLAAPRISRFLQVNMNRLLGPVLILTGMFLLGLVSFRLPGTGKTAEKLREKAASKGLWGAGLLGILFALSFCPASAALFFGSLIPLSVKADSAVTVPLVYGIGTALPVFGFAVVIALGTRGVGTAFNRLSQFEKWARRGTGAIFIGVGVYLTLVYVFGVL
jgi:cytochrome c biogenesis protein CcdA